jgi:hypothetical protein
VRLIAVAAFVVTLQGINHDTEKEEARGIWEELRADLEPPNRA